MPEHLGSAAVSKWAMAPWVGRKVALDPSVADWQPRCVSCEELVSSWNNAIALAACTNGIEDDEPDCLVIAHVVCPALADKGGRA